MHLWDYGVYTHITTGTVSMDFLLPFKITFGEKATELYSIPVCIMYMCISCTCTQPMTGLELVRTCGLTANGANGLCCVASLIAACTC